MIGPICENFLLYSFLLLFRRKINKNLVRIFDIFHIHHCLNLKQNILTQKGKFHEANSTYSNKMFVYIYLHAVRNRTNFVLRSGVKERPQHKTLFPFGSGKKTKQKNTIFLQMEICHQYLETMYENL